tara:strand:+ start:1550 stop:1816 length:267 start_codon:yes stop_codon:yes gene_type:complete
MEKINGSEYTCQKCSKSFGENRGERRSPSFEKVGRSNNPFLCLECEEGIAYAQRVDVEYHGKSGEPSLRNGGKIKVMRSAEKARRQKR